MSEILQANYEDSIKVVTKLPGQDESIELKFSNTLRGYQTFVEGYIESVPFPGKEDDMDIVMNDEGKILKQDPNIYSPEYKDYFVGPIVAVGVTPELTWRSLTDEEIEYAMKYFAEHDARTYEPDKED